MSDVVLREERLDGLPVLELEGGGLAAVLLPSVGGRIAALYVDALDLFWRDPRLVSSAEERAAMPRPIWWGGWKTWVAPQSRWEGGLPPRDLDEGAYDVAVRRDAPGGPVVRMTSPVCRETSLRIVREVSLDAAARAIVVRASLENQGTAPRDAGLWEVIQLRKPGIASFPVDAAFAPKEGGVRTYEHEGQSKAARGSHMRIVSDAAGRRAEVRCSSATRFKFGARVPAGRGWVRAAMGQIGRSLKLRFDAPGAARYAHEASVEVFCSDAHDYFEIEAHAPLATLAPGGTPSEHVFRLEAPPTKGRG